MSITRLEGRSFSVARRLVRWRAAFRSRDRRLGFISVNPSRARFLLKTPAAVDSEAVPAARPFASDAEPRRFGELIRRRIVSARAHFDHPRPRYRRHDIQAPLPEPPWPWSSGAWFRACCATKASRSWRRRQGLLRQRGIEAESCSSGRSTPTALHRCSRASQRCCETRRHRWLGPTGTSVCCDLSHIAAFPSQYPRGVPLGIARGRRPAPDRFFSTLHSSCREWFQNAQRLYSCRKAIAIARRCAGALSPATQALRVRMGPEGRQPCRTFFPRSSSFARRWTSMATRSETQRSGPTSPAREAETRIMPDVRNEGAHGRA